MPYLHLVLHAITVLPIQLWAITCLQELNNVIPENYSMRTKCLDGKSLSESSVVQETYCLSHVKLVKRLRLGVS